MKAKQSVILMRAKDKKRREQEKAQELQEALDRDHREGRRDHDRICPLIREEAW